MILVNVYVPAVEHTYDFRLNESFAPGVIVNELCEMVEQKEQLSPGNGRERLMLFVRLCKECCHLTGRSGKVA